MKKLSDYLHLYIGVTMKCTSEKCNSDNEFFGMERKLSHILFDSFLNGNWMPILRPLNDMKEDEAIDLFKLCSNFDLHDCTFDFHNDEKDVWINAEYEGRVVDSIRFIGDNLEMMNNDGSFSAINPISPLIHNYLNKGFDLFGLIESGLAIDKSSLPSSPSSSVAKG